MPSQELTSTRSPRVSAARRLAKRAFRAADRKFLAEGPQAVREALRRPGVVHELFCTAEAAGRHPELLDEAQSQQVPVHVASGEVMAAIAQTVTPQGVVAVCRLETVQLDDVLAARPRLVAVLAHARDPGNAGTVIRTADAAGAEAVVVTDASVDVHNPKCVRATAGSLFHLPVVTSVTAGAAIHALRASGLTVLGADGGATLDLDEAIEQGVLARPSAWVFGNEAWGLPADVLAETDLAVRVPIHGGAESLNLATAAAVCLYASARAQRAPGGCRRAEGG